MRWFNHVGVAGALWAVHDPGGVPLVCLGATAPDWLEWVAGSLLNRRIKHRTVTHVLATWLLALAFFGLVWDWRGLGLAFAAGGCIHWLQDGLTITGVPLTWWSDRRTTLLGGRLRTGGMAEYGITIAIVAICAGLLWIRGPSAGYVPFFRDWSAFYREGLADGAEWRAHRFEWF